MAEGEARARGQQLAASEAAIAECEERLRARSQQASEASTALAKLRQDHAMVQRALRELRGVQEAAESQREEARVREVQLRDAQAREVQLREALAKERAATVEAAEQRDLAARRLRDALASAEELACRARALEAQLSERRAAQELATLPGLAVAPVDPNPVADQGTSSAPLDGIAERHARGELEAEANAAKVNSRRAAVLAGISVAASFAHLPCARRGCS